MIGKNYLSKNKDRIIPQLKYLNEEGIDQQLKLTRETPIKELDYNTWFWMHPSAYQLLIYGKYALTIIILATTIPIIKTESWTIISLIFIAIFTWLLSKEYYKREQHATMTHYDLYMRK